MLLVKVDLFLFFRTIEALTVTEWNETTLCVLHAVQRRIHVARLAKTGLATGRTAHRHAVIRTRKACRWSLWYFRLFMETAFGHLPWIFAKVGREALKPPTRTRGFSDWFEISRVVGSWFGVFKVVFDEITFGVCLSRSMSEWRCDFAGRAGDVGA